MEKISVVVPVYNVADYLSICVDSILHQTYKNIEVILIDDGSTDGSGEICDYYGNSYNNVRVFHKANEGLGITRNYGLDKVSGEYVTFVDSDDYIAKDAIQNMYDALKKFKADYCKSGFARVDDEKKILRSRQYSEHNYDRRGILRDLIPKFFGSAPEKNDSVEMCVCACLFKNAVIKNNRIRFLSEREVLSEDILFSIDYLRHAERACVIEYVGYYYRVNGTSLSNSYRSDRFEKSKHLYGLLNSIAAELGYGCQEKIRITKHFFINIRSSLAQEKRSISGLSSPEMRRNIKKIIYDSTVQHAIEKYPVKRLGLKQQVFLHLVRNKKIGMLCLLVNKGVL